MGAELDEPFEGRPYTLRQLLQHQAGVPDYGSIPSYHEAVRRGENPWDVGQLLDRVGADRLDFEPGHGWRYPNVGYLFVRQKIEEKIGRDIGSALKELVFGDLGLTSVRIVTTAEDLADTAWGNNSGYDPGWVYHEDRPGLVVNRCTVAGLLWKIASEFSRKVPTGKRDFFKIPSRDF
ncbi:MAG: hypothetical protein NTAFB05_04340 [Nitrobacter sp.]|uniref:serine hydrolase n=1 Tax=Nitrobacter sp. TaxID=29420 RepID=UPI00387DF4B4